MSNCAAVKDGNVVNIVVLADDADLAEFASLVEVDRLVPLDSHPESWGIGWRYEDGKPVPPPSLTASRVSVPVGESAVVTCDHRFPDAPSEVTFTVNGATATVALVDGKAELEVTVPEPGPVQVSVDVLSTTLTIEGVQPDAQ